MQCKLIDFESADWDSLDRFSDRTVFQTREWIRFVSETQKATPVLVQLIGGNDFGRNDLGGKDLAGYFTGLTFNRLGVKILGSSFPGWTTPYIGFNLLPGVSRRDSLAALEQFAWDQLKCLHMEISDPNLSAEDGKALGFTCSAYKSYRTDLTKSEEDLFNGMDSACRRCIRKAEKSGITIEEAHDARFADEYYAQLKDVFAKQKLVPTYDVDRVRSLIKNLEPAGRVLLVRARDSEGNCIASGIFPGFNKTAEFWGNASFRSSQNLRPNELIHWYAMRYWKKRGVETYDWGGEGKYKEKYGCVPYAVSWLTKSRYEMLGKLRDEAKKMFERKQKLMGWLNKDKDKEPVPGE